MSDHPEQDPKFTDLDTIIHGEISSPDDINVIQTLIDDALKYSEVFEHVNFYVRLDEGRGLLLVETTKTGNRTYASIKLQNDQPDNIDDQSTIGLDDDPFVTLHFDSVYGASITYSKDDPEHAKRSASKIVLFASEAAASAPTDACRELFAQIARIGQALHDNENFANAVKKQLKIGDEFISVEEAARLTAKHIMPHIRQDKLREVKIDQDTILQLTSHQYTSTYEQYYFNELPRAAAELLKNRVRLFGLCILHSGEAFVTYLSEDEEKHNNKTIDIEDLSQLQAPLRQYAAEEITGYLVDITVEDLNPK